MYFNHFGEETGPSKVYTALGEWERRAACSVPPALNFVLSHGGRVSKARMCVYCVCVVPGIFFCAGDRVIILECVGEINE